MADDNEDVEETTNPCLHIVKVAKNGRVTIPKKIRDELGIKEDDRMFAVQEGRSVRFVKGVITKPEDKN